MSQTASAEAIAKPDQRPLLAALQASAMVSVLADFFVLTDLQTDVLSEVLAAYISQNETVFPSPEPACAAPVDSIFFARRPSLIAHS